jgi:hypothetical protein
MGAYASSKSFDAIGNLTDVRLRPRAGFRATCRRRRADGGLRSNRGAFVPFRSLFASDVERLELRAPCTSSRNPSSDPTFRSYGLRGD